MAWVWTTVGAFGLAVAVVCCAAAVAVYSANARRLQNRLLALILFGQAGLAMSGIGLMYMTDDVASAFAWQIAAWVVFSPVPWLYAAFLSTLDTPLARPLGRARPLLYVGATAASVWPVVDPQAFLVSMRPGTFAPWDVGQTGLGEVIALRVLLPVSGVLGLVVAGWAWLRSRRGTLARAQASAYLLAFATFDVKNLATSGYVAWTGRYPLWLLYVEASLALAFVLFLAYGVLKAQLFDIDLKVKWTIQRGTVASAFVGVFFVATTVAEQYLERYGVLAGGVAAGLLLVAFRPLERAADRLADAAMPRVQDTQEYRTVRKREVYRAGGAAAGVA